MSVDTFPELTPPVLIIGTLAPGLGPKDVEKTITWRLEKYVSATPGVDHVESLSRNNFSVIYVWLKWGTDLNAAQTLVQSQAAFAMAAVPKSLGVLPPFVLQYDPSNAPVVPGRRDRRGLHRPAALRLRLQLHRAAARGHLRRRERRAATAGGCARSTSSSTPSKAQARNVTAEDVAAAVAKSNALLPSGEFIAPEFDANVYTNAIPSDVATIGEAPVKVDGRQAASSSGTSRRVEDGGTPRDAVGVGRRQGRGLPQRPPRPRRQHASRSSTR